MRKHTQRRGESVSRQKVSTVLQVLPHLFIRPFPLYHHLLPSPSFSVSRSIRPSLCRNCAFCPSPAKVWRSRTKEPLHCQLTLSVMEKEQKVSSLQRGREVGGAGVAGGVRLGQALSKLWLSHCCTLLNFSCTSSATPSGLMASSWHDAKHHPPLPSFFRLRSCQPPCGSSKRKNKNTKSCDRRPAGSYSHASPCTATLASFFLTSSSLSKSFSLFRSLSLFLLFVCVEGHSFYL